MTSTSIVSQIPKLKGASNFDAWYNGLKGVAKVNGAWKVLTGATPKPQDGGKGDNQREKQTHSKASKKGEGCGYCHSSYHQERKCWFKNPDQAKKEWREKNK